MVTGSGAPEGGTLAAGVGGCAPASRGAPSGKIIGELGNLEPTARRMVSPLFPNSPTVLSSPNEVRGEHA